MVQEQLLMNDEIDRAGFSFMVLMGPWATLGYSEPIGLVLQHEGRGSTRALQFCLIQLS